MVKENNKIKDTCIQIVDIQKTREKNACF